MRHLNPTLYEVIYEWYKLLPTGYDVKTNGNTRDNLKNSQEAIISCLVEQLPKSYRESYETYRDLFSQIEIFSTYDELKEINILALATGSGGDVFGLIHACELFFRGKRINIFSVDGNQDALQSQVNLFRQCFEMNLIENDVQLIPIHTVIEPGFVRLKKSLDKECFNRYGIKQFDIVQSMKWMNEQSIRDRVRFYDLFLFMNQYLANNRVAVILEEANPSSPYTCDQQVSLRAIKDYARYSKEQWSQNHLVAFTPTPCIARWLNGNKAVQCTGCTGCYTEIESYVKLGGERKYSWHPNYVFVMKLASGKLGEKIVSSLQDEAIGYQTATQTNQTQSRFCTLDAGVAATKQANAFLIHQHH